MTNLLKVYGNYSAALRMILLFVSLHLISLGINAQNTEPVVDTAVLYEMDTVVNTVEAVKESTDDDDEAYQVEEVEKNYFLPKYMIEYGAIDSFKFRHLPPAVLKSLKEDKDFSYANKKPADKAKARQSYNSSRPVSQHPVFQTILWLIVIGGFVAFLVIYLLNSNVNLFRKSSRIIDEEETDVMTDDIFAISYAKEIDKATANGDYRLAIRLMFLRLLRNMAEREIINYKQDRTDFDYLLQLQSTRFYSEFFRIVRHYEYSWYGKFSVDSEKYERIKNDFEKFDLKLGQH